MKTNIRVSSVFLGFGLLALGLRIVPVAAAAPENLTVASVTPQVVTRSGPVTVNGSGFGEKGSGSVLIGGARAWTTTWTDTQIVAYVPESAVVGRNAVEIVTGRFAVSGPGLAVEARSAEQPTAQGTV
ncbi:MAG: IPT/TIG domain-containing protein, partial [Chthoniobacterales bacterium]|nr:IPT/TIG domain-containing protein [Chthoniobacterales bacterium]